MTAPLLSLESLAPLRAANRASLVSRAIVERRERAGSVGGGANTAPAAWVVIVDGDDVPCRIAPVTPGPVSSTADQTAAVTRWQLVTDVDAPVLTQGMRVTIDTVDPVTRTSRVLVVVVVSEHGPRTFSAMRAYDCTDAGPGDRS